MFEVLLTLCLAGAPGECRVERHPGGATMAACTAEAERLRRAADMAEAWPCVPAGDASRATEVAPGVFVHKGQQAEANPENAGDLANTGFVIGERAVAVIDAGGSAAVGRALLREIRARTVLPVEWVILTHMHPDHVFGAEVFAGEGARIVGHPRLARALAARGETYLAANERLIGAAFAGTALPAAIEAAPGEIDLGGRVLVLEAHGTAHTDNDLTILDRATGTWFLGDLVFLGHLPALDGSLAGWIDLLDRLAARPAARAVPGHGPVAVDWPAGAAPTRAYLAGLADTVRQAIAAGTPMLDTVRDAPLPDPALWLLGESFHPRNLSAAYKELEWE